MAHLMTNDRLRLGVEGGTIDDPDGALAVLLDRAATECITLAVRDIEAIEGLGALIAQHRGWQEMDYDLSGIGAVISSRWVPLSVIAACQRRGCEQKKKGA